jgi:hypothetical protein
MVLLDAIGQAKTHFRLFGVVLISMQDRCTVCVECTTGMEIFSSTPNGTLGDVGQVEVRFGLFGDSTNLKARYVLVCAKHTISSEISLGTLDSTPRCRISSGRLF